MTVSGDGGGWHWFVRMEWRPAGWSVCLPLLIFLCTIKSRSSLLALAHPGGPSKRAVKRLCVVIWLFRRVECRKGFEPVWIWRVRRSRRCVPACLRSHKMDSSTITRWWRAVLESGRSGPSRWRTFRRYHATPCSERSLCRPSTQCDTRGWCICSSLTRSRVCLSGRPAPARASTSS